MTTTKLSYTCKLCQEPEFRYFQNIRDHLAFNHQIPRKELNIESMKKFVTIKKILQINRKI